MIKNDCGLNSGFLWERLLIKGFGWGYLGDSSADKRENGSKSTSSVDKKGTYPQWNSVTGKLTI